MDKTYRSISSAAVRPLLAMSLLLSVVACKTCKKEEEEPTEESTENTTSSDEGSKTNKIPFAFTLTAPAEKNDVRFYGVKSKKVNVAAGDLVITVAGNTGDDASKYSLQMTCTAYEDDGYTKVDENGKEIVLISPAIGRTLADLSGKLQLEAGTINVPFTFEAPADCTSRSVKVEVQLLDSSGNIVASSEVKVKSNETPFAFTLTGPAEKSDVKFYGVTGMEIKKVDVDAGVLVITIAGNTGDDDASNYRLQATCTAYTDGGYTNVDEDRRKIVLTSPVSGKTLADLLGKSQLEAGTINVPFTFKAPADCTSRSVKVEVQLLDLSGNILASSEVKSKSKSNKNPKPFTFTLISPGEHTNVQFYNRKGEKSVKVKPADLQINIITGDTGDDDPANYKLVLTVKACSDDNYMTPDTGANPIALVSPDLTDPDKLTLGQLSGGKPKLVAGKIKVPFTFEAPSNCTSRSVEVTAQLKDKSGNNVGAPAVIKVKSKPA